MKRRDCSSFALLVVAVVMSGCVSTPPASPQEQAAFDRAAQLQANLTPAMSPQIRRDAASRAVTEYEEYLKQYPNGGYVRKVNRQIAGLRNVIQQTWNDENNQIINDIVTAGVGGRLAIPDLRPQGNITGAYQFIQQGGMTIIAGPTPNVSIGDRSTIAFKGRVPVNGYVFDSDKQDPLIFVALRQYGFVYLRGTGTVTSPDGKQLDLRTK